MYYIQNGLGMKWLAKLFALFGVGVAFFGIGTFGQVNSIAAAAETSFNIPLISNSNCNYNISCISNFRWNKKNIKSIRNS